MGSLGSYKYPEHTIDQAFQMVKTIDENNISKQELLAEELGHSSPDSGAFRNKLTSLRRYGLINKRGEITLSRIAKDALRPGPDMTQEEALGRAVENVDFLSMLYKENDYNPPGDKFWYNLYELAEVEKKEAQEKQEKMKKLYESGLRYAKSLQDQQNSKGTAKRDKTANNQSNTGGQPMPENVELQVRDSKGTTINVVDESDLTVAKALIEQAEKKLKED